MDRFDEQLKGPSLWESECLKEIHVSFAIMSKRGIEVIVLSDSDDEVKPQKRKTPLHTPCIFLNAIPGLTGECASERDNIRIEQIFSGDIEECTIFTFILSLEFLVKACPILKSVPTRIVHGMKDSRGLMLQRQLSMLGLSNVVLHEAELPFEYGTHHTKMMLLKYSKGIRICITTANLIPEDFLFKTQGFWVRDFPSKNSSSPSTDFERDLKEYLDAYRFLPSFWVSKYDWSTAGCHLVTSVPGYHRGNAIHRFGHMRMRSLLNNNSKSSTRSLICQFTSIGVLSLSFLQKELFQSFGWNASGKLIWPTLEEVQNSVIGYASGGTIAGSRKNMKPFLRPFMCKWDAQRCSGRGRFMPHMKSYIEIDKTSNKVNWFTLTSSNLSRAAWGSLQKNDSQLMIRNYEIGVLFKAEDVAEIRPFSCTPQIDLPWTKGSRGGPLKVRYPVDNPSDEKCREIPLPYSTSPSPYEKDDRPWTWDEPHREKDVCGETWNC